MINILDVESVEYNNLKALLSDKCEKFSNCTNIDVKKCARNFLKKINLEKENELTLDSRSYIPQEYAGIIFHSNEFVQTKYKYLATHGIATCVACVLYSKAKNAVLLTHFDDRVDITGKIFTAVAKQQEISQEKLNNIIVNYSQADNFIREHKNYFNDMIKQLKNPDGSELIFIPSEISNLKFCYASFNSVFSKAE